MTEANWIALGIFIITLVFALLLEQWRTMIVRSLGNTVARDTRRSLTVIVPARDAVATLPSLLQDLYVQDIDRNRFEVIVVDDHSTDGTIEAVQRMMRAWPQLKLIQLKEQQGKKAAITAGVYEAANDLIVMTDADVRCGAGRLSTMLRSWEEHAPHLLLMPVFMRRSKGLLAALQGKEQLALQAVAIGTAEMGAPMLAYGANMAFSRSVFISVGGFTNDRWASGDDMFLLYKMKRAQKKIVIVTDPAASVITAPEPDLRSALQQRLRWAGKMRAYRDPIGGMGNVFALSLPFVLAYTSIMVIGRIEFGERSLMSFLLTCCAWLLWSLPVVRLVSAAQSISDRAQGDPPSGTGMLSGLSTIGALIAFSIYAPIIFLISIFVRPMWKGRRI